MQGEVIGTDINAILAVVKSCSDNGDVQLSTLAHALAVACKSCGIDRANAIAHFSHAYDAPHKLVPYGQATN
jgi:hypothetical protein